VFMFVPSKPFQHSLLFAAKAVPHRGVPPYPLGWPGTNALAHLASSSVTKKNKFCYHDNSSQFLKTFSFVIYEEVIIISLSVCVWQPFIA
jgi:hypothetical protein